MLQKNIQSIALPRLRCGLDKLSWFKVLEIVTSIFGSSVIKVKILVHPPNCVSFKLNFRTWSNAFIPKSSPYNDRVCIISLKIHFDSKDLKTAKNANTQPESYNSQPWPKGSTNPLEPSEAFCMGLC